MRPCSVGRLPKWPTGADCKSAGLRLRWFESITYHQSRMLSGLPRHSAQHEGGLYIRWILRATPRQASLETLESEGCRAIVRSTKAAWFKVVTAGTGQAGWSQS